MSEIQSNRTTKLIAIIVIGVVVTGGGIFGIGKLIQYLTEPDEPYTGGKVTMPNYNGTLTITDIDGNVFNWDDHKDKCVVLYYYFLNCPYCPANAEALNSTMQDYSEDQLIVISISIDSTRDTPALLQEYADEHGYTWMIALDSTGDISSAFQVTAAPTTIYLKGNGDYRVKVGAQSEYSHKLQIDKVLDLD